MMMMGGPGKSKKIATIIIGGMKSSGGEKSPDKAGDDYGPRSGMESEEETMDAGSALKSSARAIMSAIKDGDESALLDSLQTFFMQCQTDWEKSEDENEAEREGY